MEEIKMKSEEKKGDFVIKNAVEMVKGVNNE